MITKSSKHKGIKLLALLFSASMITASITACSSYADVDSSSVKDDEEAKSELRIKNGDFETFDSNDGKNLIVSPTSWTKSLDSTSKGTAPSSSVASGIIDLSLWKENGYLGKLIYFNGTEETFDLPEIGEKWGKEDEFSDVDKLYFIQKWTGQKDSSGNKNKVTSLAFYDEEDPIFSANIDYDDVPTCANPLTHNDVGDETENKAVLMIHNDASGEKGTAQKYTSSSTVTLSAGTTAKFSVWVKTDSLTYANSYGDKQSVVDKHGAYVSITQTVGSATLDPVVLKNINTSDVEDHNGWEQYTFYLTGCDFAESSFSVVFGLGMGGGVTHEYVEGYAFFDDAVCEIKRTADFQSELTSVTKTVKLSDPALDKAIDAKDYSTVAVDLTHGGNAFETAAFTFDVNETEEKVSYKEEPQKSGITDTQNDYANYKTFEELLLVDNAYLAHSLEKDNDADNYPFASDTKILTLYSVSGAPYTATANEPFVIEGNTNQLLSFWLKTSKIGSATGAGVKLIENGKADNNVYASLSTDSITLVDVDDKENIYDGWQHCYILLENKTAENKSLTLAFTYGPTSSLLTATYSEGYAMFADFETVVLSNTEAKYVNTGTYVKAVVYEEDGVSTQGFDSAAIVPTDRIQTNFAALQNYYGVYGGSDYIRYNEVPSELSDKKDAYAYAGLLNKEYIDAYVDNDVIPSYEERADYEVLFGNVNQPLVIYSTEEMSYGYIGASKTLSANTYSAVSVKVKASVGAKAYVYLMDTTPSGYPEDLTIKALNKTYYYDKDGNVCDTDPEDKDFRDKSRSNSNVAFLRQANGLFEINPKWSGYKTNKSLADGKYFANLSNYDKDENGNLIVAKGGVTYLYDSAKDGQGNDGIAFYFKDGKYYAYSNYTTEVNDLALIDGLARYSGSGDEYALNFVVDGDVTTDWVNVTFYIHTGIHAKNYRLEVFSGSRDGEQKNPAGSVVAFDANNVSSKEDFAAVIGSSMDLFSGNDSADLNARNLKDALENDNLNPESLIDKYALTYEYSGFSFYDSKAFLRYDATLDNNDVGNSYDDYTPDYCSDGSEKETLLYLGMTLTDHSQAKFIDYAALEYEVTPDDDSTPSTDDDDEDTSSDDLGANIWLLASSLVLALVLLFAIVSIVVRKVWKRKPVLSGERKKLLNAKKK